MPDLMVMSCDVSPRQLLHQQLQDFARLANEDLRLTEDHLVLRTIPRHGFFNFPNSEHQHSAFIVRGLFRVYYVNPATDAEHVVGSVKEGTFITSLESVVMQESCPYYIAALEDAELLVISVEQLHKLYDQSLQTVLVPGGMKSTWLYLRHGGQQLLARPRLSYSRTCLMMLVRPRRSHQSSGTGC